jgi:hypothetical protein
MLPRLGGLEIDGRGAWAIYGCRAVHRLWHELRLDVLESGGVIS